MKNVHQPLKKSWNEKEIKIKNIAHNKRLITRKLLIMTLHR